MSHTDRVPRLQLTRRHLLMAGGLAVTAAGVAIPAPPPAAASPTAHPDTAGMLHSLGYPVVDVANAAGDVGTDAAGNPWIYTVSSGSAGNVGRFHVVDARTGLTSHTEPLHGPSSFGVLAATSDHTYVSDTAGHLYRWTSSTSQWEDLGIPVAGETIIYRLTADASGRIHGGTYPNGKLFRYDPATDEYHDYGQLVPGQNYVRSVAHHDGVIYAGTQPRAHLVAVEVGTGTTTEIDFPAGTDLDQLVHDMHVFDGRLYARLTKAGGVGTLYVRDLTTGQWVDTIDGVNGRDISPPDGSGQLYFLRGSTVVRYDPSSQAITDTPVALSTGGRQLRGMGWVDLQGEVGPGLSLVAMITRGEALRFNPANNSFDTLQTDISGTPVSLRAIATDDQGQLHAGATNLGGHAIVDPQTGSSTQYVFGEYQGMVSDGSDLYLGIYGSARIFHLDSTAPWNTAQDPAPSAPVTNPVELFDGAGAEQDRPFGLHVVGDQLAVGTVSRTGVTGGALTLHDLNLGTQTVLRSEFVDASVIAVASNATTLFCGTSIHGGYGSTPTGTDGKVVALDLVTGSIEWEAVPVPGDPSVSALTIDAAGRLWGITAGNIFSSAVTATPPSFDVVQYAPYSWPSPAWLQADLLFNPVDGFLYATVPNHGLLQIDPATGVASLLDDNPSLYRLAVDTNGQLFVSSGAELFRVDL